MISIEGFLRGCFDVGYEASVVAQTHGPEGVSFFRISVYRNAADVFHSEYRAAEGSTWAQTLTDWESAPWTESIADAMASARAAGGWG